MTLMQRCRAALGALVLAGAFGAAPAQQRDAAVLHGRQPLGTGGAVTIGEQQFLGPGAGRTDHVLHEGEQARAQLRRCRAAGGGGDQPVDIRLALPEIDEWAWGYRLCHERLQWLSAADRHRPVHGIAAA